MLLPMHAQSVKSESVKLLATLTSNVQKAKVEYERAISKEKKKYDDVCSKKSGYLLSMIDSLNDKEPEVSPATIDSETSN